MLLVKYVLFLYALDRMIHSLAGCYKLLNLEFTEMFLGIYSILEDHVVIQVFRLNRIKMEHSIFLAMLGYG